MLPSSMQQACSARLRPFVARKRAGLPARRAVVVRSAAGDTLQLFSPAKVCSQELQINLFLRVVRRREDGYHDLASLFHVIDLGDAMEFEELGAGASTDVLTCDMAGVPTDDSNLVIKAFDLFRKHTGVSRRFRVDLRKRVPHGAGMGGGSGNAATALWAANELSGRPASAEQLLEWSGEIGGEIVEDVVPPLPLDTPLLLVKPPVGLSTPEIFRALDLDRRSTADPRALLARMAAEGVTQELTVNDLEQPAFDTLPQLAELKRRLQEAGGAAFSSVFMTGSGSTIVCVGSDAPPAFLAEPQYASLFVSPARLIVRKPGEWARAALCVRCDDDEIVPILRGRRKSEFTAKELEALRKPRLLGGKTIGQELSMIRKKYKESEVKMGKAERSMSSGGNWDGDVYLGGRWNELTILYLIFLLVPLAGLVFAWATYGTLWATGQYY
eukprot:scaffold9.g3001.t1